MLGGEGLQAGFQTLFRALQFFHKSAIAGVRVLKPDDFQFVQLLLEEPPLGVLAQWNPLEAGVRDDDGVPIAGGDAAEELLAVLRLEIHFARDQDIRAGIKREQFGRELAEHVVGHGEHRLAGETKPL